MSDAFVDDMFGASLNDPSFHEDMRVTDVCWSPSLRNPFGAGIIALDPESTTGLLLAIVKYYGEQ